MNNIRVKIIHDTSYNSLEDKINKFLVDPININNKIVDIKILNKIPALLAVVIYEIAIINLNNSTDGINENSNKKGSIDKNDKKELEVTSKDEDGLLISSIISRYKGE